MNIRFAMFGLLTALTLSAGLTAGCLTHDVQPPSSPFAHFPSGPVDGYYLVRISDLADDRVSGIDLSGQMIEVDALAHLDGTIELISADAPFPLGIDWLEGIVLTDGRVDHVGQYQEYGYGTEYRYSIVGYLKPGGLDLRFDFELSRGQALSFVLTGRSRPLVAADADDGFYALTMRNYGRVCPGQPLPDEPTTVWPSLVNVRDYQRESLQVQADASLRFAMPRPDRQDRIDHRGLAKLSAGFGWSPIDISLSGQFSPSRVDLRLEIGQADPTEGLCAQVLLAQGQKIIPSLTEAFGFYRARYRVEDSCAEPNRTAVEEFHANWLALPFPDGQRLRVRDASGVHALTRQPNGSWGYQETGEVFDLTYRLWLYPQAAVGQLSFDYPAGGQDGKGCQVRADIMALKRFVFPPPSAD